MRFLTDFYSSLHLQHECKIWAALRDFSLSAFFSYFIMECYRILEVLLERSRCWHTFPEVLMDV